MKIDEIRSLGDTELSKRLEEAHRELFNLRFQHEVGQLENPKKLVQTKRDIARMQTILREVEIKQQSDNV